jgi:hypothetical protein
MRNSIKSIEHRSINGRGMEDLNKFKQKMHEEIKDISAESQNVINQMDINELVGKINKNGIVFRIVMSPIKTSKHAFGCMDLMEHMETVGEKYAACRFFHLLEIGSKKWPELALFAKAFLERSGGTTKTAAC